MVWAGLIFISIFVYIFGFSVPVKFSTSFNPITHILSCYSHNSIEHLVSNLVVLFVIISTFTQLIDDKKEREIIAFKLIVIGTVATMIGNYLMWIFAGFGILTRGISGIVYTAIGFYSVLGIRKKIIIGHIIFGLGIISLIYDMTHHPISAGGINIYVHIVGFIVGVGYAVKYY